VPIHVTVCMGATITGLIFLSEAINSHTLTTLLEHLCNYERICALLQQDSSTAHITANSTHCLQGAFSDSIMSQGLWRPHSK